MNLITDTEYNTRQSLNMSSVKKGRDTWLDSMVGGDSARDNALANYIISDEYINELDDIINRTAAFRLPVVGGASKSGVDSSRRNNGYSHSSVTESTVSFKADTPRNRTEKSSKVRSASSPIDVPAKQTSSSAWQPYMGSTPVDLHGGFTTSSLQYRSSAARRVDNLSSDIEIGTQEKLSKYLKKAPYLLNHSDLFV